MASAADAFANAYRLFQAGQFDLAERACQKIIVANPRHVDAIHLLGIVSSQLGKSDFAVECLKAAIKLNPNQAAVYNKLAGLLQAQGKLAEAIDLLRSGVKLWPSRASFHYDLAQALMAAGKTGEATESCRRALELVADNADAFDCLGSLCLEQGEASKATEHYRRALELKPTAANIHGNYLLSLQYLENTTLADLAAAHAEFERRHAAPLRASWRRHDNRRDPQRPLRLGFVSADFGQHPVGNFVIAAFENMDDGQFVKVCFSDRRIDDALTKRFRAASRGWHDTSSLNDVELAGIIRDEEIDILFDLAGHTAKSRLLVFARKPAPIQITWAGYAGTTGLGAIDYLLADRYEVPPDADPYYQERVLRMPDGYVCYAAPDYAPEVTDLPALRNGYVTFGSFNIPAKISSRCVRVWALVLKQVANSRLLLKHRGYDQPDVVARLTGQFAAEGIEAGRIAFQGWSQHAELLRTYNEIDLALDTLPYSGGLTTCEALWVGVPVLTCPGETFASRHSLSHVTNAGLENSVAADCDAYAEMAVAWARDLPRLASVRAGLRPQVAMSPLCNGKAFAENLGRALRQVWQDWCQSNMS